MLTICVEGLVLYAQSFFHIGLRETDATWSFFVFNWFGMGNCRFILNAAAMSWSAFVAVLRTPRAENGGAAQRG